MYNIISILVFIICVVMSVALSKLRHGEIVVRILSALILVYKFLWYVKMNICGVVSINPLPKRKLQFSALHLLIALPAVNLFLVFQADCADNGFTFTLFLLSLASACSH